MTFRVGQKVVCVDDAPKFTEKYPYRITAGVGVTRGEVYTIRGLKISPLGDLGLLLVEAKSKLGPYGDGSERGFLAIRFRPIVERKTDISIFTRMLLPQGVDA